MNGSYYQNPTFPGLEKQVEEPVSNVVMPTEVRSVKETDDILKNNRGRKVKVFASFPNSTEWQNKIFEGVIENSTDKEIIISDPKTGEWNVIPYSYIDYFNFNEKINM